jgi:transglutaminase-like putative cysteine protease
LAAGLAAVLSLALAPSTSAGPQWLKAAIARADGVVSDPDAPALILHHSEVVRIDLGGTATTRYQKATRILTRAGKDQAGFSVSVRPGRKVKGLNGWLVKPDGKETKLDKKQVVELDHDYATGYYDDDRVMVASFADVNPGDVVAYEFDLEEKDPWAVNYHSFTFQSSLPVVSACFEIALPDGWELLSSGHNIESVVYQSVDNRHIWTANDLHYRPTEPFMPPWSELNRELSVGAIDPSGDRATHASWNSIAGFKHDIRQAASEPGPAITELVNSLCAGLTTTADKVKAISRYVQGEIRYVAVEIGAGRFVPRQASHTLANRYGDCKDKTALMQSMLSVLGIPSAAVNACLNGAVDPDFPSAIQFDHVIIAFPLDAVPEMAGYPGATVDGWLFFDPTNEWMPLGTLSSSLRGSYVLRLTPRDSATARLPVAAPEDRRRLYRVQATLLEDFSVSADASITDYGIWGAETAYEHATEPITGVVDEWKEILADIMQDPVLSDVRTGADADSAWITFRLEGRNLVKAAGAYLMLKADLMHRDRPDDLTDKVRVHPISFGLPAFVTTEVKWTLPEGWTIDGEVKPIQDSCALAKITSRLENDSILVFRSSVEYYGGKLPVDEYDSARRFNQSLRASQKTRVFLNRGEE